MYASSIVDASVVNGTPRRRLPPSQVRVLADGQTTQEIYAQQWTVPSTNRTCNAEI